MIYPPPSVKYCIKESEEIWTFFEFLLRINTILTEIFQESDEKESLGTFIVITAIKTLFNSSESLR